MSETENCCKAILNLENILYDSTGTYERETVFRNFSTVFIVMGCLTVLFLAVAFYFFRLRHDIALRARSSKLMIICLSLLFIDSMGQTLTYGAVITSPAVRCKLEIFICQLGFYGATTVYLVRMFRIERVYRSYTEYIQKQIESERAKDISRKTFQKKTQSGISGESLDYLLTQQSSSDKETDDSMN